METIAETNAVAPSRHGSPLEVLRVFLKLGLTCFGGPVAHIGYFRDEFVLRRKWIDEHAYADLVGLCQFLPGPASSKVGFSIGLMRAGYAGALAAWAGFTPPAPRAIKNVRSLRIVRAPWRPAWKALTRSGDRFDRRTPWDWNGTRVSSFSRRTGGDDGCAVES